MNSLSPLFSLSAAALPPATTGRPELPPTTASSASTTKDGASATTASDPSPPPPHRRPPSPPLPPSAAGEIQLHPSPPPSASTNWLHPPPATYPPPLAADPCRSPPSPHPPQPAMPSMRRPSYRSSFSGSACSSPATVMASPAVYYLGVSNCYVFKSRLQEYAQKMGHPTPVYETYKEGPCHEPYFRSTVIVNDVRYDSLPGFFNRKAAEQSAAEVALVELSKSSEVKECISVPVHETGLCKNLLQEYAQKMNFAIPMYYCQRDNMTSRVAYFSCTVEIGGMRYIGGAARTKKEAEIKAARTALLAIQSTSSDSSDGYSQLTVIPGKKRESESVKKSEETPSALKPKKGRFKKKKMSKQRRRGGAISNIVAESRGIIPGSNMNGLVSTGFQVASDVQVGIDSTINPKEVSTVNQSRGKVSVVVGDVQLGMESSTGFQVASDVQVGIDSTINPKEVSTVNQSGGKVSVVVGDVQLGMESSTKAKEEALNVDPSGGEVSVVEVDVPLSVESSMEVKEVLNVDLSWGKVCGVVELTNGESLNGQSDAVQSYHQSPNDQTPFVPCGNQASVNAAMGPVEIPIVTTDLNGQSDADQSYHQRPNDRTPFVPCGNQASVNAATGPVEVPIVTTGLSQPGESIQAGAD